MTYDVIVVGGGPAGLSAAQNVRARGRTVLVVSNPLEENPLWKAERVDNYPGLPGRTGLELLEMLHRHAGELGAEFVVGKALSLLEWDGERLRVIWQNDNRHLKTPEYLAGETSIRRAYALEPGLWFRAASEGDGTRTEEALLEEEVSGTISMALEPEALRITDYQLVPALRGQRYGIQLLGQAVQYARTRGREALVLRCPEELKGYFAKYGFVSSGAEMVMDLRRIVREIPSLG